MTRSLRDIVVGIGEMRVAKAPCRLVTYGLGSCLGIVIHDPEAQVGGLLHAMVPSSSASPDKALLRPYLFVDVGVPLFFKACYQAGVNRARIVVKVAGGSNPQGANGAPDFFRIGERNLAMFQRLLAGNGIVLSACEVGGHSSRTVMFDLRTGQVHVKSGLDTREL